MVEVIDIDDFKKLTGDYLGFCEFELGDIVGSQHNMKIMRLKDFKNNEMGKCICRLDKVDEKEKKNFYLSLSVINI